MKDTLNKCKDLVFELFEARLSNLLFQMVALSLSGLVMWSNKSIYHTILDVRQLSKLLAKLFVSTYNGYEIFKTIITDIHCETDLPIDFPSDRSVTFVRLLIIRHKLDLFTNYLEK